MKAIRYFLMFLVIILASLAGRLVSPDSSTASALMATAAPTRTPIRYFLEFKKANLNKVPPKDILQQISFFGGGGGVICVPGAANTPVITFKPNDGVLMTQSTMIACGWEKGEVLKGTIIFPNGAVLKKTVNVLFNENMYYGKLSFTPGISDPVGNYTFILEGKAGIAKDVVNFKKPVGPHLFVIDSNTIMLYGFSSQEKVRLFYYASGKLAGWQEYTMDGNGQLILKVSADPAAYFWAVGKSGEAPMPGENLLTKGGTTYPALQQTIKKTACGELPSRLTIQQGGKVAFTNGADMRVRSAPGLSQNILAKVPEGSEFIVVQGPKCADGVAWWKVNMSSYDLSGWVAESYDGVYLLEP